MKNILKCILSNELRTLKDIGQDYKTFTYNNTTTKYFIIYII